MTHVTCLARLRQPADHADAGLRRAGLAPLLRREFAEPSVTAAHGVAEGRALPGGALSPVLASGKAFDDLDDLVAPEALVPCVFE
jgi:hypothetical protein